MTRNKRNKYLIIALVVVLVIGLIVGIVVYAQVRKKSRLSGNTNLEQEGKRIIIPNNTKTNLSNSIIVSIPAGDFDTYDVDIIFGGIGYANPEWMYSQIPKDVLYRDIVVVAPYTTNLSKVESVYKSFLDNKGYINKIKDVSIMGFSAGGPPVFNSYSQKYKLVGLIDPSTRESYKDFPYTNNTIMVYNERNWGGQYDSIKKAMPIVADSINKKGGRGERVNLSHDKIPKYFFEKYLK